MESNQIATITVSLMKDMDLKDVDNILLVFSKLYAGVAEIVGTTYDSTTPVSLKVVGSTEGGRKIPIVNQDEIKARVNAAQVSRVIGIRSAQAEALPTDVVKWAQDNEGEFVVDNSEAKARNPKAPDYKLTDANGNDIKSPDGKSVSLWRNRK